MPRDWGGLGIRDLRGFRVSGLGSWGLGLGDLGI